MKKVNAFAAVVILSVTTFAFTTRPVSDGTRADSPMLKMVEQTMHEALEITPTNDRNRDFVRYVQVLHKGGMQLAQFELANGHHEEVKAVAKEAIDSTKSDMMMLDKYLAGLKPKAEDIKDKFANEAHDALYDMVKESDNTKLNGDVDHDYTVLGQRITDAEQDVAQAYVRFGADPMLERIAKRMVDTKKEEMKDLKEGKQEVKREDKK